MHLWDSRVEGEGRSAGKSSRTDRITVDTPSRPAVQCSGEKSADTAEGEGLKRRQPERQGELAASSVFFLLRSTYSGTVDCDTIVRWWTESFVQTRGLRRKIDAAQLSPYLPSC